MKSIRFNHIICDDTLGAMKRSLRASLCDFLMIIQSNWSIDLEKMKSHVLVPTLLLLHLLYVLVDHHSSIVEVM